MRFMRGGGDVTRRGSNVDALSPGKLRAVVSNYILEKVRRTLAFQVGQEAGSIPARVFFGIIKVLTKYRQMIQ